MNDWAAAARRFVRASEAGSLATLSRRHPGYPFGSIVSFAADERACPVFLASRLAEHTANLQADPRASLLVQQPAADPLSAARVTLVADAEPFDASSAFTARYLRHLPQASRLLELGDFRFVRLRPRAIRFIAGFGAIRWIDAAAYFPPWSEPPELESETLQELRTQRLAEVHAWCSRQLGRDPGAPEIVGVDCDGIDVRAHGSRLRLQFPAAVGDRGELLRVLSRQAERAP